MAEFCILHLSYLHIKGTHLSKTMLNLIADIKNQNFMILITMKKNLSRMKTKINLFL